MVDPDIATTQPAIPLSLPGQEVRANVSRPLARRRPVGYRRAFLDDYQPNDSFLLPQELPAAASTGTIAGRGPACRELCPASARPHAARPFVGGQTPGRQIQTQPCTSITEPIPDTR